MGTRERRELARVTADDFGGALSRAMLRQVGVDDRMVRREVAAQRWRVHGRQTIAMHTGELGARADRWRAIWEVGAGIAALDGVTALAEAGMSGFTEHATHVSVLHRHDIEDVPGVRIHKLIRRPEADLLTNGIPRVRPPVAAIHGAHWAVSDRQAALILCMPVQQRLVTGQQLLAARKHVKGRTRRRFIDLVIRDIALGAQSLGELDFAEGCRMRGLPEPERQVIRRGAGNKVYLDARWPNGLVVEIDGSGHHQGLSVANDNLRANAVALTDDTVLRIDLVGWRLFREEFLDQVCAGYWMCQHRLGSRYPTAGVLP